MKIRAALTEAEGAPFAIGELELEAPRADEVLVRFGATRSDGSTAIQTGAGAVVQEQPRQYPI